MKGDGWHDLAQAAREQDLLDAVDLALIRSLAGRAGRPEDAALQAVLGCLSATVHTGALRIPVEEAVLAQRLEAFFRSLHLGPDLPAPDAAALAAAFTAARLQGAYAAVLGAPPAFLPLLHSAGGLYFQKHHAAEALAGTRLGHFLSAPPPALAPEAEAAALETVLHRYPLRVAARGAGGGAGAPGGRLPMEFRGGQREALVLALRSRFLVVSGGPGTGKTSLVANILRAWLRAAPGRPPQRIRLAAPTGRAARRLAEALRLGLDGIEYGEEAEGESALDRSLAAVGCETLHRLLRYHPATGEFYHRRGRPLPADLVVVDEASMVDIFTLARLLDGLEDGASLILLGDMDQLPSVDAGAVLADLVSVRPATGASPLRGHLALLASGHRSGAGILEVTRRINAMDAGGALAAMAPPLEPGGERSGCRLLLPPAPEAGYAAGRNAWLDAWMESQYAGYGEWVEKLGAMDGGQSADPEAWREGLEAMFACLDRGRILTLTRKGWYGSVAVNRHFRDRLARRWQGANRAVRGEPTFAAGEGFHGAPILILENDADKDLQNGEVGVLLRQRGRETAFFQRGAGYLSFPARFLPRHELAFAMTVHKSQGSEYDEVLLILPEAGNRLLFKETLYTALTRARRFAGIYGSPEVFREAVGKKVVRESGLAGYLETSAGLRAERFRSCYFSPRNGLMDQP